MHSPPSYQEDDRWSLDLCAALCYSARVLSQNLQISENRVGLGIGQILFVEMRQDAETMSDLKAFQEIRTRLVVQRASESCLAAWVTPIAFLHKDDLPRGGLSGQRRGRCVT